MSIESIIKNNFPDEKTQEVVRIRKYERKESGSLFLPYKHSKFDQPTSFVVTNKHYFLDTREFWLKGRRKAVFLVPVIIILIGYFWFLRNSTVSLLKIISVAALCTWIIYFLVFEKLLMKKGWLGVEVFNKNMSMKTVNGNITLSGKRETLVGWNFLTIKLPKVLLALYSNYEKWVIGGNIDINLEVDKPKI